MSTPTYTVKGRGEAAGEQIHSSEDEARRQMRRSAEMAARSGRPFEVSLSGPTGELARTRGGTAPERLRKA